MKHQLIVVTLMGTLFGGAASAAVVDSFACNLEAKQYGNVVAAVAVPGFKLVREPLLNFSQPANTQTTCAQSSIQLTVPGRGTAHFFLHYCVAASSRDGAYQPPATELYYAPLGFSVPSRLAPTNIQAWDREGRLSPGWQATSLLNGAPLFTELEPITAHGHSQDSQLELSARCRYEGTSY